MQQCDRFALINRARDVAMVVLERRLRVSEPVIKFLTVRIDEEQKRLDKIKQLREARRKAPPAPATPEAGGEATAPVTA